MSDIEAMVEDDLKEKLRLEALRSYQLLDTPPEESFDRLTRLAALICRAPISLVSLVDESRQWFKSRVGLAVEQTPRDVAFCDHVIHGENLFQVSDTLDDPRFRANPLVLGDPHIRFYAGFPLIDPQGNALGTLCVIDHQPRQLDKEQLTALELLAQEVMAQIVARQHQRELHSLEQLFQLSPDLIGLLDAQTRFVRVNPSFERLLGWSRQELFGFLPSELVHADDAAASHEVMQTMGQNEAPAHFGNRLRTKSGDYLPIDWILKSDPTTGMTFAIGRDATSQKAFEGEMARAREQASLASRAKSEFLATMSHEIRTPLNGVIGFTDILLKTPLDETQQQFLGVIHQSAISLLDIVSDILDFTKIEEGKVELDLQENDLHEMASQVVDAVSFQANQKKLEVLLDLDPHLPSRAVFDPVRLRQVLVNLLGNAVKFTQKGEIELKISVTDGNRFVFAVRDTGIGIKPQYQKKIFEAFTQEDTSTTRRFGGTGLGLAISSRLLALMNSSLSLESVPGHGTTFHFELVLETRSEPASSAAPRWQPARVLLVDDNAGTRRILKQLLDLLGLECQEAATVGEADALLSQQDFRLVLLDQQMPPLSNLDKLASLPVVLLASPLDKDHVPESNSLHRLVKPVKAKDLVVLLEKILGRRTPETLPAASEASPSGLQLGPGLTILIADDNSLNVFLARTVITLLLPGCVVLEAANGKVAYEKFLSQKPDLILMDVQMPLLTGLEATRKIRTYEVDHERPTRVPIVALTAGAVKTEREACLACGMDDYLSKPFVKDDLLAVLVRHLHSTGKS